MQPIDKAIAYKEQHPDSSVRMLSAKFDVPKSTLADRIKGTHEPRGVRAHGRLTVAQEEVLVNQINAYASRGTCLTPRHLKELAETMCRDRIGVNWGSTFIQRHQDQLSSRFIQLQDLSRITADNVVNCTAFYNLLKDVLQPGTYLPGNVYNMDEVGFSLSTNRRVRRVVPKNTSVKSQARMPNDVHITVVAAISTLDAPVPPYVLYPGLHLLQEWINVHDPTPPLVATTTESGYANSYTHLQWLETVFDRYTKDRAHGSRRLLFMDGAKIHLHVDFLEACWARNIDCIVLPANLSSIFQPLDVNYFNQLKTRYDRQLDDLHVHTGVDRLPKGVFYRFFQRAWGPTANSRQIRDAWADSGIWPLSPSIMRVATGTPERIIDVTVPLTPENVRMIRSVEMQARSGDISWRQAMEKTSKSLEKALVEKELIVAEQESRQEGQELLEEARGGNKRTKYAHGQVFDQQYAETHVQELAERKEAERKAAEERKKQSRSKRKGKGRALEDQETAGPSTTMQEE